MSTWIDESSSFRKLFAKRSRFSDFKGIVEIFFVDIKLMMIFVLLIDWNYKFSFADFRSEFLRNEYLNELICFVLFLQITFPIQFCYKINDLLESIAN